MTVTTPAIDKALPPTPADSAESSDTEQAHLEIPVSKDNNSKEKRRSVVDSLRKLWTSEKSEKSEISEKPEKTKSSKKTYIVAASPPSTEITPAATRTPSTSSIPQSPVSLVEAEQSNEDEDDGISIPLPPTTIHPTKILDIDANTPDSHVARDPRMIRFLTPPELFYVRNHGAVPEVLDSEIPDWSISIEGLVEKPFTITFREILEQYQQVTVPITLVCAGNRRKEQNTVRKSQGFSWGPGGVSTALFTGPMLCDVLQKAKPTKKAKFLCMEGADELPNGNYGTSIKLSWAMTRERGIMLAHKMNGLPLTPDHGRPIRVVIPCQIGGRSVKWLKRLVITDKPSGNWYHKYDNRVLPTTITPEMSKKDDQPWEDERYAIYDLNVNSAVAYPQNDEVVKKVEKGYTFRGYAYTGGMKKISRVEVSLDKGQTWKLAKIDYPEDRYRETERTMYGGKVDMMTRDASYCWCFWEQEITMEELVNAEDVVVRAMDDGLSLQQRDMYWSVLGMMHNAWFRVAIRKEGDSIRFEHPTVPAQSGGGWMERVIKEGGDFSNGNWGEKLPNEADKPAKKPEEPKPEAVMTNPEITRIIELEELKAHSGKKEPWFVVEGQVYDGTPFLKEHPGGATSIINVAATDATDEFVGIHSESAKGMMPTYHIGTLSPAALSALLNPAAETPASVETPVTTEPIEITTPFLEPKTWKGLVLSAKRAISSDTKIFTFTLPSASQPLGLPVGQHLLMRIKNPVSGKFCIRAYTPLSTAETKGSVDVLVKLYQDGAMSKLLDKVEIGSEVGVKGPTGKFVYGGKGKYTLNGEEKRTERFNMICGGSGITPVLSVLRAAAEDEEDKTVVRLLDGNRTEEDILCRGLLAELEGKSVDTVSVLHTLSKPSEKWEGRQGRIDEELIRANAAEGAVWLVCGPPALEKEVKRVLGEMGVAETDVVFF
ncbi:Similar to Nitrate reductase [NADPH]; acc. no. P22945 [Pyronema omphalodes CBS 100304]|uniref:Nitrate reductase [NADPH] n=2 Tax=Pyronema TaxID=47204 RepID=U4LIP8_PYROM|nr:Similar to Nitrate reductase [NADPH]; acc. no. P22945 [Pyronema omphalodes CBS 100304]